MRGRAVVAMALIAAALVVVPVGVDADLPLAVAVFEGQVTLWGTDEPVEGAEVRGWYEFGWVTAVTGADGYYHLETVEPGEYTISFHRPGIDDMFWYYPGAFTVTDDEVYAGIDGTVQDAGTMIGRVTDDATGQPIGGICADVRKSGEVVGISVSDDDGWLLYPDIVVDGGWYESSATLYDCNNLGYADERYRDRPAGLGGGTGLVEYQTYRGRFDAEIGPPGPIAGTVTSADGGAPLGGICVSLDFDNNLHVADAVTDGSGYYEFGDITAGDQYVMDFEDCSVPVGYRTVLRVDATATSGTTSYYDQVLEPTASISGTVTDASTGLPLEGICVLGTDTYFMGSRFGFDTTDSAGMYSLAVGPTVEHQYVRAYWCGDDPRPYEEQWWDGVTTYEEATDLQIGPLEHRVGVDLALLRMASLQGTLIGADGLPAETHISLEPLFEGARYWPRGVSNPDGSYRIDHIEPGAYNISFGSNHPTSTYALEWYDDVLLEEDARPVVFGWGDVVTIDVELEQLGVIEWLFNPDSEVNPQTCAYVTSTDGTIVGQYSDRLMDDFVVGGLVPGDYLLFAEDCDTADPEIAPVWYPDAATRADAATLTVNNDLTDLAYWDVTHVVPDPSTLTGQTTRAGQPWDACVDVFDEDLSLVAETVASGGSYSVGGLSLRGPEAGLFIKAEECSDPVVAAWYGGATQQDAAEIPFGLGVDWTSIDVAVAGSGPGVPGAPGAVPSDGEATLAWTAADDGGSPILGYDVELEDQDAGGTTVTDVGVVLGTTLTGLNNGTTYRARVRATNALSDGIWSAWSSDFTPGSVPDAPGAPAANAGDSEISLSWDVPADGGASIINYEVHVNDITADSDNYVDAGPRAGDLITGLANGSSYRIRVRAENTFGIGSWSDWSAETIPMAVPNAPSAPAFNASGAGEAAASWLAPDAGGGTIGGYEMELANLTAPSLISIALGSATLSHAFTGLVNGDVYRVRVRASNAAGWGAWSDWSNTVIPFEPPPPPPPSPDPFSDDDSSVFEADIEWLANEGVTRGCNPPVNDEFCPDESVTRGQMAAFLSRALELTARLDDPFSDDDGSVFEADIERLAAAGITKGCNPPANDRFCPSDPVTRAQMAAFLVRALGFSDAGDGDLFTDDDGSIFEEAIDKLATAGVTRGCNPPTNDEFCPNDVVTRGQMAAFLHRALG